MNAQSQKETKEVLEIARMVEQTRAFGEIDLCQGKRGWTRYNAALQLEATKDPTDPSSCWTISMHNVSLGGFAAWSKRELELHDTFYVREFASEGDRPWLEAVVRHCTRGIRGFLIGAEFTHHISRVEHDDSSPPQDVADAEPHQRKTVDLVPGLRR